MIAYHKILAQQAARYGLKRESRKDERYEKGKVGYRCVGELFAPTLTLRIQVSFGVNSFPKHLVPG